MKTNKLVYIINTWFKTIKEPPDMQSVLPGRKLLKVCGLGINATSAIWLVVCHVSLCDWESVLCQHLCVGVGKVQV